MALAASATGTLDISDMLRAGREHYRRGEIRHAIAVFQVGLARAATASISVAVDCVAELHAALANAFMLCDDIASAGEHYKAALRIAPHLVACWCNLGIVHQRSGQTQDAVALYLEALRRNPGHRPSRTNLVQALVATRQFAIARTLLLELLEETPEDADLRSQLGKVCFELGETEEAVAQFERAVVLAPGQAENFYWIGAIRQASRPRRRRPTPTPRKYIRSCAGQRPNRRRRFGRWRCLRPSSATRRSNSSSRTAPTRPASCRCCPAASRISRCSRARRMSSSISSPMPIRARRCFRSPPRSQQASASRSSTIL
jgi:tetratricopeptide (TPR) repeat protein